MSDQRTARSAELLLRFAERTGLTSSREPRRYLWTDAFAVCTLLGLHRSTGDARYRDLALRLVDQVHQVLGRHRPDDARRGWISGLSEEEGALHPTAGGLRIGKPLPERAAGEPLVEALEWDRDGQYFHYLTKWMHALDQVTRATGDPRHNAWARELARAAHRAFVYTPRGVAKRMYWKMSVDLSRPLVPSMGQHDPLDGLITCVQLDGTLRPAPRQLDDAAAQFTTMVDRQTFPTSDPLGLGGLLVDAYRVRQLVAQGALASDDGLMAALLAAALFGLHAYVERPDLQAPPSERLAFRELGLAIGLAAIDRCAESPPPKGAPERANLDRLLRYAAVREEIEATWLRAESRETKAWRDHADINDVMLAATLEPAGFLDLHEPPAAPP